MTTNSRSISLSKLWEGVSLTVKKVWWRWRWRIDLYMPPDAYKLVASMNVRVGFPASAAACLSVIDSLETERRVIEAIRKGGIIYVHWGGGNFEPLDLSHLEEQDSSLPPKPPVKKVRSKSQIESP